MEFKRLIIKEALELQLEYRYREALEVSKRFYRSYIDKDENDFTNYDLAMIQYAETRIYKYTRILTFVDEIKGFITSKGIKENDPKEIEKEVLKYYEEKYNPNKDPRDELAYYMIERIKKYVSGAILELMKRK